MGPTQAPPEPQYPEVSISNPDLVNLPNIGKSVISHEVVSRTHEKGHKGKPIHRIRLRIKNIRPMGRHKSSGSKLAAENAMRGMMSENE